MIRRASRSAAYCRFSASTILIPAWLRHVPEQRGERSRAAIVETYRCRRVNFLEHRHQQLNIRYFLADCPITFAIDISMILESLSLPPPPQCNHSTFGGADWRRCGWRTLYAMEPTDLYSRTMCVAAQIAAHKANILYKERRGVVYYNRRRTTSGKLEGKIGWTSVLKRRRAGYKRCESDVQQIEWVAFWECRHPKRIGK